jgi:hypothetical protein
LRKGALRNEAGYWHFSISFVEFNYNLQLETWMVKTVVCNSAVLGDIGGANRHMMWLWGIPYNLEMFHPGIIQWPKGR